MNIKEEHLYELLLKEKDKTLSASEIETLEALRADKDMNAMLDDVDAILTETEFPALTETDKNNAWSHIQSAISEEKTPNISKPSKVRNLRPIYLSGIAASLILLVCAMMWWNQRDTYQLVYQSELGTRKIIELKDGTIVHLNGGSSLTISDHFGKKNRTSKLSGEAFFKVAKNKHLPFVVSTNEFKTEVTGTQYSVCDYQDQKHKFVKLHEGGLRVHRKERKVTIEPGEMTTIKGDVLNVSSFPLRDSVPTWTLESLKFDKTPISQVIESIENYFGVEIENQVKLGDLHYTHHFKGDTLDHVLQTFTTSIGCKFKKQSDKKYLILKAQ